MIELFMISYFLFSFFSHSCIVKDSQFQAPEITLMINDIYYPMTVSTKRAKCSSILHGAIKMCKMRFPFPF